MLRKSVVILAALLSSVAAEVYALGLGSVSVESALNQPLRVRIEVLDLGETRLQDVFVQMASTSDFERFNINRVSFLNSIDFAVEETPSGNFLVLTSTQIVREPFLSFILETRWPNGRLLSEHTILLDLPVFGGQPPNSQNTPQAGPLQSLIDRVQTRQTPNVNVPEPPALAPPSDPVAPVVQPAPVQPPAPAPQLPPEPAPAPVVEPQPSQLAERPEPTPPPPRPAPQPEPPTPAPAFNVEQYDPITGTFETAPGDTLYGIATRVRPDRSVSLQQTMIALQRENPHAFINDNINRLRSGEVLRIPDLSEIQAIDPREAIDEVARQNREVGFVEPLAPRSQSSSVSPPQQGQLSVLRNDSGSGGAGSDSAGANTELDQRIADLENQLALRQEEADRARIERAELEARFAALEEQIADAQEIIRLQDLQLAQLQGSLAEAAVAQAQAEAVARAAAEAAAQADTVASNQPLNMVRDFVDRVMGMATGNALMMLGGFLFIVLLLLVLLLRRRGSADDDDDLDRFSSGSGAAGSNRAAAFDEDEDADLDDFMGQNAGVQAVPSAHAPDFDDDFVEELEADDDEPEAAELTEEEVEDHSRVSQVNEEAVEDQVSVLITHGQLQDAGSLLQAALENRPDDHELRLKYCEVLGLQNDAAEFEEQASLLADQSPKIDRQLAELRERNFATAEDDSAAEDDFASEVDASTDSADAGPEVDVAVLAAEKKTEESGSFLDDLGIDLDDFEDDDDDDFEFSAELEDDGPGDDPPHEDPSQPDQGSEQEADESVELEFEDSDDMDLTFDLTDDSAESAEAEPAEEEEGEDGAEVAFDLEQVLGYEPDLEAAADNDDESETDAGDFHSDSDDDYLGEDGTDTDDFATAETDYSAAEDEDTGSAFGAAPEEVGSAFDTAPEEVGSAFDATLEDDSALDTDSGDVSDLDSAFALEGEPDSDFFADSAPPDSEEEQTPVGFGADLSTDEEDENSLDFDFDTDEVVAEATEHVDEGAQDLETFDFNLDGVDIPDREDLPGGSESELDSAGTALDIETIGLDADSAATGAGNEGIGLEFEDDSGGADEVESFDFDEADGFGGSEVHAIEQDETDAANEMTALSDASDLLDDYGAEQTEAGAEPESAEIDDFDFDLDDIELGSGSEVEVLEPEAVDDSPAEEPVSMSMADEGGDDLGDLGFLSGESEATGQNKVEIESISYDDEFEFLSDEDETATKLELAYAYQKMGDTEGAREILQEVTREGSDTQIKEAQELMAALESTAN